MFTVTTPATDRSLLSLAELRAAATVSDNSQDASLLLIGKYVDATITKACRVVVDGAVPPTMRLETLTEIFRSIQDRGDRRHGAQQHRHNCLILSRRPVVDIISVTENGTLLDAAEYEVEAASGLLYRLSGTAWRVDWCGPTATVAYTAGYATVPDDLKYAAIKFVQSITQQAGRDPLLTLKRIEGVSEYRYWVDPTKDTVVPAEVMDLLEQGGYVNTWIG